MTQITSVIYCLSTSLVSLYFDLKTLFVYMTFSVIKKRKYRNDFYLLGTHLSYLSQSYHLLVYALMQFSVQLCMSANYACNGYGAMTGNSTMLSLAYATNPYILTVFCLSSPICLFATRFVFFAMRAAIQGSFARCYKGHTSQRSSRLTSAYVAVA